MLGFAYAQLAGLLHSAALCAAESFPLDVFLRASGAADWLLEFATRHDFSPGRAPIDAAVAAAALTPPRTYRDSVDATLAVHTAAIAHIVRASRDARIDGTWPKALHDAYARASAQGHADHDIPAIYESFVSG